MNKPTIKYIAFKYDHEYYTALSGTLWQNRFIEVHKLHWKTFARAYKKSVSGSPVRIKPLQGGIYRAKLPICVKYQKHNIWI